MTDMIKMELFRERGANSGPGVSLPKEIQEFYGSDLVLPAARDDRAVANVNFVETIDGIVNIPDEPGGKLISGGNAADLMLMAVLRGKHGGVAVGSETLESEPDHIWNPDFIAQFTPHPEIAAMLNEWRTSQGMAKNPWNIILTRSGTVKDKHNPAGAKVPMTLDFPVFNTPDVPAAIVTTAQGKEILAPELAKHKEVKVLVVDADRFEEHTLEAVKRELGVDHLLIEGGPTVNTAFLKAGMLNDLYLTQANTIAGRTKDSKRASLFMGFELSAGEIRALQAKTKRNGIRAEGEHMFFRISLNG